METQVFVLGDRPCIADFSMAGYHYYGEETGIDCAAEFPLIAAWTKRIADLPGWRSPEEALPQVRA